MESADGKRQRNALTAAERAIRALGNGKGDRAMSNARKAADLDQIGLYAALPGAIDAAAAQLETSGAVDEDGWNAVANAVGAGPLEFLVTEVRDG